MGGMSLGSGIAFGSFVAGAVTMAIALISKFGPSRKENGLLTEIKDNIRDIKKILNGNGRPGLVQEVERVKVIAEQNRVDVHSVHTRLDAIPHP